MTFTELEADFTIVPIIFLRASKSSVIISITAALKSVLTFFFTSFAPSTNPVFYLHPLIVLKFKTKLGHDFIADFGKIFGKSKKALFSGR